MLLEVIVSFFEFSVCVSSTFLYAGLNLFQSQRNSFLAAPQEIQALSHVILLQNEVFMVPSFLAFIRVFLFLIILIIYSGFITNVRVFVAPDDKFFDYPSFL